MNKYQEVLKALGIKEYLYFVIPRFNENQGNPFYLERIEVNSGVIEFNTDSELWVEDADSILDGYAEWLDLWPKEMYS